MNMQAKLAERKNLTAAVYNLYSPDNFPGSKKWWAHNKAEQAVKDFDSANPEVIAYLREQKAKKDAAEKAYWDSPEGREKMMSM